MSPEGSCVKDPVDSWWILGCSNSSVQWWVNNLVISLVVGTRRWGLIGDVGPWGHALEGYIYYLSPPHFLPPPASWLSV